MSDIIVHYIDTFERPEEASEVFLAIDEEAKKIYTEIDKPIFIAYRLEEVFQDGSIGETFIKTGAYNKLYLEPLFRLVLGQEEDPEAFFEYKDEIGSDVVKVLTGDFGRKAVATWKMTEIAIINPLIPKKDRVIDKKSSLSEIIMEIPEYTRHVSNSGFFNGKIVENKVDEFKEHLDRSKQGLMLLIEILENAKYQKRLFRRCQIPLISTYKCEDARKAIDQHEEDIEKGEKAIKKAERKAKREGRDVTDDDIEYTAPSRKEWLASLDPIVRRQVREIESINDYTADEIMKVPCIIHTLKKAGVSKDILKELKKEQFIYGNSLKMGQLTKALNKYKIQLCVFRIKDKSSFNMNYYPKKIDDSWTTIKVDIFENHMFIHTKLYCEAIKREVSVLRMLSQGFEYGLLEHFSAYEFAKLYQNLVYDAMIKFDHNDFIAKTPNGATLDEYCRPLQLRDSDKSYPDKVYYADFECTTNEEVHIPYMVHCIGPGIDKTYYGEDCGRQMLADITRDVEMVPGAAGVKQENVRVYFHNLKYDFTFIKGYLSHVKTCERGMKLYSAEGWFRIPKVQKSALIQFWDTLPIMRCKLSKAAESYIGGEEAKKFKKEMCPYKFYTRRNFKVYRSNWAPIEDFIKGFESKEEGEEFLKIVSGLPIDIYDPKTQKIQYMNYSAFYCRQDVIIMKQAFENIRKLFLGAEEIPGINGTPPFQIDIYNHRTISSLAWRHFLVSAFGQSIKEKTCPIYEYSGPIRNWLREAGRGGRTMMGDNKPSHYVSPDVSNPEYDIVDYDAVSLYPTAGSKAWIPEGKPIFIKSEGTKWTDKEFKEWFGKPEEKEPKTKYTDGMLHITWLNVNKDRSFPLICIKDPKTKLNNYENFHDAKVDTIISMVDLYNLIDLQEAEFTWDAALVWEGKRNFECQHVFKDLNDFRKINHNLKDKDGNNIPDHPIAGLAKLVNNSIYGKANQKVQNYETLIIDKTTWQVLNSEGEKPTFSMVPNWEKFFNANAYRIIDFEFLNGYKKKVKVRVFKTDLNYALVNFAVNILGFSKRIIGPVIAIGEEAADELDVHRPFYTDTDSVHLIRKTLPIIEAKFQERFGYQLSGPELGQFHIDFDAPRNYKKGEKVRGAIESYFCAKKVYVDKLLGDQGSVGHHMRMKGMASELITWDDFVDFYNDKPVVKDLVQAKPSFDYVNGDVTSLRTFIRKIMTRACRNRLYNDTQFEKIFEKETEEFYKNQLKEILNEDNAEEDVVIIDEKSTKRPRTPPASPEDNEERPTKLCRCDAHL